MAREQTDLKKRIRRVSSRWKTLVLLKGSSRVLLLTMAVFIAALILDASLQLSQTVRFLISGIVVVVFVASLFREVVRPFLRVPNETQIARFIEERHPQLEDRLVTAIELSGRYDLRVPRDIITKLIDDAKLHTQPLQLRKSLRPNEAFLWSGLACVLGAVLVSFFFSDIMQFSLRMNRIFTPWEFRNVTPKPVFSVSPGDARVPRGSVQEIRAELSGFEVEEAVLYYDSGDSSWVRADMTATLSVGVFVHTLFDVAERTRYYVKAGENISDIFTLDVFDPPQITRIELKYRYPDYTGLKPKTEKNGGDIWAPQGTIVELTAVTDKPLQSAQVTVDEAARVKTAIRQDTLVTAQLTIDSDSYYKVQIRDFDNLTNEPAPEFYIHALPDQPPVITVSHPGRDLKASMVEEVPLTVHVEDDYGTPSLALHYTVNGSEERVENLRLKRLHPASGDRFESFESTHLFYLEDIGVQPGDFLTYHIQASDRSAARKNASSQSDIFFIEVRPFDQAYFRPLSQGGMGGQGGGMGRLSQTQKEIVIATWKLLQKQENVPVEQVKEDTDIIEESQKNLLEITQNALFQMRQRSLFSGDQEGDITEYYQKALAAMQGAVDELTTDKLAAAFPHEKEALAALLAAEAQMKEIQVQRGQGSGNMASLEELSDLFNEEMDKVSNKYETLQQNQQRRDSEELNRALEKVKDLARRQQQFNEKMRDLSRENFSEEEEKRRIEALRRQQEEIRRQTQELAKRMQQQNNQLPRQIQENLQRASSEMTNASNSLSNNQSAERAAAKGTRALNRLKQLEDLLAQNQREALRRQMDDLDEDFREMAQAQQRLSDKVGGLSGNEQDLKEQMQEAEQTQKAISEKLANVQEQLASLSRQARSNKSSFSRDVNQVRKDIENARMEQKLSEAQRLLEQQNLSSAQVAGRDLAESFQKLSEEVSRLQGALAETEEEKLDLALDQTRRTREQLETLQRRFEPQEEADSGQNRQAGPGESKRGRESESGAMEQMSESLAKSLKDLEFIEESLKLDSSLSQKTQQLRENIRNAMRTFDGNLADRWAVIQKQVLNPLGGLETELAERLEIIKNKEKLFLAKDARVPSEYRELVDKYYELLSKTDK